MCTNNESLKGHKLILVQRQLPVINWECSFVQVKVGQVGEETRSVDSCLNPVDCKVKADNVSQGGRVRGVEKGGA